MASGFIERYGPFIEFKAHFRCLSCAQHGRACVVRAGGNSDTTCLACTTSSAPCLFRRVLCLEGPLRLFSEEVLTSPDSLDAVTRLASVVSGSEPNDGGASGGPGNTSLSSEVEWLGSNMAGPSMTGYAHTTGTNARPMLVFEGANGHGTEEQSETSFRSSIERGGLQSLLSLSPSPLPQPQQQGTTYQDAQRISLSTTAGPSAGMVIDLTDASAAASPIFVSVTPGADRGTRSPTMQPRTSDTSC